MVRLALVTLTCCVCTTWFSCHSTVGAVGATGAVGAFPGSVGVLMFAFIANHITVLLCWPIELPPTLKLILPSVKIKAPDP